MKKSLKSTLTVLSCIAVLVCASGCGSNNTVETNSEVSSSANTSVSATEASSEESSLWETAVYDSDTEIGEGSTTVEVEVDADGKAITFTVNTDKEILGDALTEHKLISGEEGEYGLYVKEVNGIKADYDVDKAYWAFYKDGEYMNTGIDQTKISDGEHYELVYTKG